jgi:hypothetical protein
VFADGVDGIVAAQQEVARDYFTDGSIEGACPPLKALLHIMAFGSYEGLNLDDAALRTLFTRESVLESAWYKNRLSTKQARDISLWQRHVGSLERFRAEGARQYLDVSDRLAAARLELERVSSAAYVEELVGTIGADPFDGQLTGPQP